MYYHSSIFYVHIFWQAVSVDLSDVDITAPCADIHLGFGIFKMAVVIMTTANKDAKDY